MSQPKPILFIFEVFRQYGNTYEIWTERVISYNMHHILPELLQ